MVFASLVSAFSWTRLGRSDKKDYLNVQKHVVLSSKDMREAFERPLTYHNIKNWWPTFLEVSEHQEMPSKYMAFCGVVGGMILAFPIGFIIGILT